MKQVVDLTDIAKAIVRESHDQGIKITTLGLFKLTYFVILDLYANYPDVSVNRVDFENWDYGAFPPLIKKCFWCAVGEIDEYNLPINDQNFLKTPDTTESIRYIVDKYRDTTAQELCELTKRTECYKNTERGEKISNASLKREAIRYSGRGV